MVLNLRICHSHDLASRLANRIQLTTGGYKLYDNTVESAFAGDIDYAMQVKQYGNTDQSKQDVRRYSPAECTGVEKRRINGDPDMKHVSSSYVASSISSSGSMTMELTVMQLCRNTLVSQSVLDARIA